MPKKRANAEPWENRLREAVREQHRFGYSIRPMRGKIGLQRYWADSGKRETATLPLEWHASSQRELLNALHGINAGVVRGLSLKEAVELTFSVSAGPVAPAKTNWHEVFKRFREHKIQSGQVKESTFAKEYTPRLLWLVEVLESTTGPNNAEKALEAMRAGRNGQGDAPGSRGRKLRVQYAAQMLRFGVRHLGLDQRWSPPATDRMGEIIGTPLTNTPKANNSGQAVLLKDHQFLELLDSIKNPSWKLAIGLLGVFGLRGVELRYATAQEDGLRVSYSKRTAKGSTKPRVVPILDPHGRRGLGRQLLLTLGSGIVELPKLGSSDAEASGAISVFLRRNAVWQQLTAEAKAAGVGRVSVYSLRHLFAWRCAMATPPVNPRAAAIAMGHSFAIHTQVYAAQIDVDGVKAAFAAASREDKLSLV